MPFTKYSIQSVRRGSGTRNSSGRNSAKYLWSAHRTVFELRHGAVSISWPKTGTRSSSSTPAGTTPSPPGIDSTGPSSPGCPSRAAARVDRRELREKDPPRHRLRERERLHGRYRRRRVSYDLSGTAGAGRGVVGRRRERRLDPVLLEDGYAIDPGNGRRGERSRAENTRISG